jgi:hypothetical protein
LENPHSEQYCLFQAAVAVVFLSAGYVSLAFGYAEFRFRQQ